MKKPSAPVSAECFISVATSYLQKEDDEFFIMAKGHAAKMKKLTQPNYFCRSSNNRNIGGSTNG